MAETNAKEGYLYTKKHEWAKIEGDFATLGITDFAQSALGDIVFIDLPKIGRKINSGDSLGVIESVKAAEDMYSPLSGEIVEVNTKLSSDPASVNQDAFGNWIAKIKLTNPSETSSLLSTSQYKDFVATLD